MKNGQYRETRNIRYTRHMTKSNKTKTKTHTTMRRQTPITNNWVGGGKDEQNRLVCGNRNGHRNTEQ